MKNSKTRNFLGKEPETVDRGISVGRRQRKVYTKDIPNQRPSYTLKIRPSGHVVTIYETSLGLDTLFGMLGGTIFFWFVLVHHLGKAYNKLNTLLKLADILYN